MIFTVLVLALSVAWVVALGRQALPRPLRVPLRDARARDIGRDAVRGVRDLDRVTRRRPAARRRRPLVRRP